jgi:FlaA1/EpsC-like NDP-sugar epimerase
MIVAGVFYLAYLARYDGKIPNFQQRQALLWLVPMLVGSSLAQILFGLHKHKWRYLSTARLRRKLIW